MVATARVIAPRLTPLLRVIGCVWPAAQKLDVSIVQGCRVRVHQDAPFRWGILAPI